MTYYEYWYNDSRLSSMKYDFDAARKHVLSTLQASYEKNSKSSNPADSFALEELAELRRQNSAYWASQIEAMTWGDSITSGNKIGSGDYSYQNMAIAQSKISAGEIAGAQLGALTRKLTSDLEEITKATNGFWDQLVKRLEIAEPAVAKAVLDRAAAGIPADPRMLNEILSRTGRNAQIDTTGLTASQVSLAQQYANLQELVFLLPTLGTAKVPNMGKGSGKGKLIATVLGKIGGYFSHLSHQVAQIAGNQAALQGEIKLSKELKKVLEKNNDKTITSGWMTIQQHQYDNIEIPKSFTSSTNVGTGQLIVSESGVVLSYGGDIPERQPKSLNIASKPIDIWDNFSLNAALNYDGFKNKYEYYLYELASVDTEELETGLGEGHAGGSSGDLNMQWKNFAEYAAFAYFIKKTLKTKMSQADTYYILGDRVLTPARLMQQLKTNPEMITLTGIPERDQFKTINRHSLWEGTRKHYRRVAAQTRSSKIPGALNTAFSNSVITARLNAMGL